MLGGHPQCSQSYILMGVRLDMLVHLLHVCTSTKMTSAYPKLPNILRHVSWVSKMGIRIDSMKKFEYLPGMMLASI